MAFQTAYSMPVIAGNPAIYPGYTGRVAVDYSATIPQMLEIRISSPSGTDSQLYTTLGGMISFEPDPSNAQLGEVHIVPWVGDIMEHSIVRPAPDGIELHQEQYFPAGVPKPGEIVYGNVEATAFQSDLTSFLTSHPPEDPALIAAWNINHTPAVALDTELTSTQRTDMTTNLVALIMSGDISTPVQGGVAMGEAAVDPADITKSLFTYNWLNLDPSPQTISSLPFIRRMPDTVDASWQGHPILAPAAPLAVPFELYAVFETWNVTTKSYSPVPAGTVVELRDYDPINDDIIATLSTDVNGRIHYSVPDVAALGEPDLFFMVKVEGKTIPGKPTEIYPTDWSTKGWLARDGTPGYHENFAGTQLGTAAKPLRFHVGLECHLKLLYDNKSSMNPDEPYPQGIQARLVMGDPWDYREVAAFVTNDLGEIHDVAFGSPHALEGGESYKLKVITKISDPSINMQTTTILGLPQGSLFEVGEWITQRGWPNHRFTFIGFHNAMENLATKNEFFSKMVFAAKMYREWSQFLYLVTNTNLGTTTDYTWPGRSVTIVVDEVGLGFGPSFNAGVLGIRMMPGAHWDRETYWHEFSHTVTLFYGDLLEHVDLGMLFGGSHWASKKNTDTIIFIEGWAELIGLIASGNGPLNIENVYANGFPSSKLYPLAPPRDGFPGMVEIGNGINIEGAMTNFLLILWNEYIAKPVLSSLFGSFISGHIHESDNGDLTTTKIYNSLRTSAWLAEPAVREGFVSLIWRPFLTVMENDDFEIQKLVDMTLLLNPDRQYQIKAAAVASSLPVPILVSVEGITKKGGGPAEGTFGDTVVISGLNLIDSLYVYMAPYIEAEDASSNIYVTTPSISMLNGLMVNFVDPAGGSGAYNRAYNVAVLSNTEIEVEVPFFAKKGPVHVKVDVVYREKYVINALETNGPLVFTYV